MKHETWEESTTQPLGAARHGPTPGVAGATRGGSRPQRERPPTMATPACEGNSPHPEAVEDGSTVTGALRES